VASARTLLLEAGSTTDSASYSFGPVSPAAGSVVFLTIASGRAGAVAFDVSSVSGLGATWTKVRTETSTTVTRTTLYVGVAATYTPGDITITHAGTNGACRVAVIEGTGYDTATPIAQHNGGGGGSTATYATTLPAGISNPDNETLFLYSFNSSSASSTPEAGFTKLAEAGTSAPSLSLAVAWRAGLDPTPSATLPSPFLGSYVAAELNVASAPPEAHTGSVALSGAGTLAAGVATSGGGAPVETTLEELTYGSSTTDSATYTTNTIVPIADRILLLGVGSGVVGDVPGVTTEVTGLGATWTKLVGVAGTSQAVVRGSIWIGVNPTTTGTITITHDDVVSSCAWIVVEGTGYGDPAVIQANALGFTDDEFTVPLADFSSADNETFAFWVINGASAGINPVAPMTELREISGLTGPTMSVAAHHYRGVDTTPAAVTGNGNTLIAAGIAVELAPARLGAGGITTRGALNLSGSGTQARAGSGAQNSAGSLTLGGSGTLTTSRTVGAAGSLPLSGSGTLAASGSAQQVASGSLGLGGSGALTTVPGPGVAATSLTTVASGFSTIDGTQYVATDIAVAASSLVLVAVASGLPGAPPSVPSVSGLGGEWTELGTAVAGGSGVIRSSLWLGTNTSGIPGSIVITHDAPVGACAWTVIEAVGYEDVVQAVSVGGTYSTYQANLAEFASPNNETFYAVAINSSAGGILTVEAGYTELAKVDGILGPTMTLATAWLKGVDTTPSASTPTAYLSAINAIELAPGPAGGTATAGSVALSGAGSLGFGRTVATAGSVALSGTGTLAASGSPQQVSSGAVGLSGAGTLTFGRSASAAGAVALSGAGTLSRAGVTWQPLAFANLTSGTARAAGTTYTTGSFTPTVNSLLLLSVSTFETSATQPTTPTVTGHGLTWNLAGQALHDTAGGDRGTTFLFIAQVGPSSSAGTVSIVFPAAVNRAGWIIDRVTGHDPVNPIRQQQIIATEAVSAATPIGVASALRDADSRAFSTISVQQNTGTIGYSGGWTQLGAATAEAYARVYSAWSASQNGTATYTAARSGMIGVEVVVPDASAGASSAIALSGDGTLTIVLVPHTAGAVGLSGAGTLTAAGTALAYATGAVDLSGAGALTVVGAAPTTRGSVALSGTGTLEASGTALAHATGTVSLTGSGTLTVAGGAPAAGGAVALSGSGTLALSGAALAHAGGSVALSGAGTLSLTAQGGHAGVATLSGSGALVVIGAPTPAVTLALSGEGTFAGTGVAIRHFQASADLTATSGMVVGGTRGAPAAAALVTASTLTAGPSVATPAAAALTATSSLGLTAAIDVVTAVALVAVSSLVPSPSGTTPAYATLTAESDLAVGAVAGRAVAAELSAVSDLTVGGVRTQPAAADLAAASTLTATGVPTQPAAAALTASSDLTVAGTPTRPATVALAATSNLTAGSTGAAGASADLAAASGLTVGAHVTAAAFADLVAASGLSVSGAGTVHAAAALTAASWLSAGAVGHVPAGAHLPAVSSLVAAGAATSGAALPITAASSLSVAAVPTVVAGAHLAAGSTLQVGSSATVEASAELVATSGVTVGAGAGQTAVADLGAVSALAVGAARQVEADAHLSAVSALAVAGTTGRAATAALIAHSTLSSMVVPVAGGADLVAVSALTVAAVGGVGFAAALTATSTLDVGGVRTVDASAHLVAASGLSAAGAGTTITAVVLAAVSTLTAIAERLLPAAYAALVAETSVVVGADTTRPASAALIAASVLDAAGTQSRGHVGVGVPY
jgi:fibronectin-binding autotransporter adhesin